MSINDIVQKFVVGVALKKGVASLAKLVVSYCAAKGIQFAGTIGGVAVDVTDVLAMTAAINTALKMLFAWMKAKWPGKFEYL